MKKTTTLILFLFSLTAFSQSNIWTWMHGSNTYNAIPVYGQLGVPDSANTPGGLYECAHWTDLEGNFWIFGGTKAASQYNGAMWKFSPQTNMWTWVKGSQSTNAAGSLGIKGVPSLTNMPRSRGYGTCTWVDQNGDLWMFGGSTVGGRKSDMWRYHIATNEWTWMAGPQANDDPGYVSAQGVEDSLNVPSGRDETRAAWVDTAGYLWMFGGRPACFSASDMWRYNINTNMWARMRGTDCATPPINYGTIGVESPYNFPGPRWAYCSYTEPGTTYLWLFGGKDYFDGVHTDVWRYNTVTNNWTCMSPDAPHGVTPRCSTGYPYGRYENSATWSDNCGHFWNYGGTSDDNTSYNDLWMYDTNTNTFTFSGGVAAYNNAGVYGQLHVPAPANHPRSVSGSNGFKDLQGNFWLFGGLWWGSVEKYANALWRYYPDYNCGAAISNAIPNYTPAGAAQCLPFGANFYSSNNNPNLAYSWNFGDTGTLSDTSNSPSPTYYYTQPGTYAVSLHVYDTITNCHSISYINVIVPGPIDIPDTTICSNGTITIGSPQQGYTYLWNTGATTPTISISSAGTYWVQQTTNGCTFTDTVSVNQINVSDISINDAFICSGQTITLNAALAGPPYSYLWNNGLTTPSINVSTPGLYWVTATSSGCQVADSILITDATVPFINLGNNTTLCQGNSLTLNATLFGTYTYLWNTNATTPTITVTNPGQYWVTVSNGTCSSSDSITISQASILPVDLGPDTLICPGAGLLLDATTPGGPNTYTWNNGFSTPLLIVSQPGQYWITVSNGLCTTQDTITIGQTPVLPITITGDTAICNADSVLLTTTIQGGPYTYLWNTGETDSSIYASASGEYWVSATINQCVSYDTISVTDITPNPINLIGDTTICFGDTILLDAYSPGATYIWSTGDVISSLEVSQEGIYSVVIKDGTCIKSFSITVDTIKCSTNINNTAFKPGFTIYPNPSSTNVTIWFNDIPSKPYTLELFTTEGKLLYSVVSKDAQHTISLSSIANGTYFIKVTIDGVSRAKKLRVVK